MKILSGIAVVILAASLLLLAGPGAHAQDCSPGDYTIQVRPDDSGGMELTFRGEPAETLRVCRGSTVRWQLVGSNRTFFVDFMGNAPFAGAAFRGNNAGQLVVTIGDEPGSYTYDIGFDGDPGMDPVIIVD